MQYSLEPWTQGQTNESCHDCSFTQNSFACILFSLLMSVVKNWLNFLFIFCSLIEFFKKIKKWQEMAKLAHDFQKKIETLERKFEVASIIFSKYNRVFQDLFLPLDEKPAAPNRRGGRRKHGYVVWCMYMYFSLLQDCLSQSAHTHLGQIITVPIWLWVMPPLHALNIRRRKSSDLQSFVHARDNTQWLVYRWY